MYNILQDESIKNDVENFQIEEPKKIRVLLVEKGCIIRKLIKRNVENFVSVTSVIDVSSIEDILKAKGMNIILLGTSISPEECLSIAENVRNASEDIGILSLFTYITSDVARMLIKRGINGILDHTSTERDLETAIKTCAQGNVFSSCPIHEWNGSSKREVFFLTTTELQILSLLLKGATNHQIAKERQVTKKTVEAHLTRIYRKIDVSSRTQAIVRAKALHLDLEEVEPT